MSNTLTYSVYTNLQISFPYQPDDDTFVFLYILCPLRTWLSTISRLMRLKVVFGSLPFLFCQPFTKILAIFGGSHTHNVSFK